MNHTEAAQYIKATLTAFGPGEAISMTKETWAKIHEAMQALAQPEQEPVAWPVGWVDDGGTVFWKDKPPADGADLYTTPPQPEQSQVEETLRYEIDALETKLAECRAQQEHVATSDTSEKRVDETAKHQHEKEPVIDKSAAVRIATALGWEPKRKPLTDDVLIPLAVLENAESSLGSFCSDHGWSEEDMKNMDNLSAYIAQHKAAHGIKE
jgi:hypothetical protein